MTENYIDAFRATIRHLSDDSLLAMMYSSTNPIVRMAIDDELDERYLSPWVRLRRPIVQLVDALRIARGDANHQD